jgi:zinc transporter, ZIP family
VIGGVVALRVAITRRLLGLVMAFGAGVLISAVAYELVHEAFETTAGDGGIAVGLLAGSAVFFAAELLIDRRGGGEQTSSGEGHAAQAGRALVLGIVLDGIPESLVLGLTVLEAGTVSVAFLVAVFLANLPEAIAATTALSRAGRNGAQIIRFWVLVAIGFGVTSLVGYVVLDAASPRTVAFVLAFAGGAVLTMLANTMMPEALHYGGKLAGLLTTVGFALAFAISSLQ